MKINKQNTFIRLFVIVVILFIFMVPILWIIRTSLMSRADSRVFPPKLIFSPILDNFELVFTGPFLQYFINSLIVSLSSVALSVVLGTPAAYALSRNDFKAKKHVAFWILSTRMAPPVAVALPIFLVMARLRLLDTYISLIIVYTSFNLSFVIWMMRGFFEDVPREIDEAAMVDGCSQFSAFYKAVLPLVSPGLVATSIFTFIFSWNEFFYALILTRTSARTVPVAIQGYIGIYGLRWGEMTAAAVIAAIPILVFAIFTQKHLVKGLTLGAIK